MELLGIRNLVLNVDKKVLLLQTKLDRQWDFYFTLNEYSNLVNNSFLNIYNYAVSEQLTHKQVFQFELEFYSEIVEKSSKLDALCDNSPELRGSWERLLTVNKSLKRLLRDILYPKTINPIIIKNNLRLLKGAMVSFNKEFKSFNQGLLVDIRHYERAISNLLSRVTRG